MSVLTCDDVATELSILADGSGTLDARSQRHVERCLRCQADVVQYRKLLRALRTLRADFLEPSAGLLPEVLSAIEEAATKQAVKGVVSGRRGVYLGGIAAAATAGAAGALVIATRNRRLRPAS